MRVTEAQFLDALCREKFDAFAQRAFNVIEPAIKYDHSWHIDCIAEHLEAVARGEITRLIINLPPRSLKSYLVATAFPAWIMGKFPHTKFICTSYGFEVVEANARHCKQIINADWYKGMFPKTKISPLLDRITNFETTQGGQYYAASALSPITGIGCFVAGTLIATNKGPVPIENLHQSAHSDILILSYNHEDGCNQYSKLGGWREKEGSEIIEIRTYGGHSVRCTADHPIYTAEHGYQRADCLLKNDKLYISSPPAMHPVQKGANNCMGGYEKESSQGSQGILLFKALQSYASQQIKYIHQSLLWMWKGLSSFAKAGLQNEILLGILWPQKHENALGCGMQELRCGVSAEELKNSMLYKSMCRQNAFQENEGSVKSKLSREKSALQPGVQEGQASSIGARWGQLCGLWRVHGNGADEAATSYEFGCSPHRRQSKEQCIRQFDNSLCELSYNPPQVTCDAISSIKRVSCGKVKVYDLTVDVTHNFYANGILAHNCDYMICDDLIKPMEAYSDTVRNSTNMNLRTTLLNRFNDRRTGKFIMIMQRLHDDDPTGHLLRDGGYHLLKLPAETKEPVTISLGSKTWKMEENGLLFPDRLSRETLDRIRLDMSEYNYAGQFLQSPIPIGGGEFRDEWLQYYASGAVKPKTMNIAILVDQAGGEDLNKKKKKSSDWTVILVVGLGQDNNYYVLDMIRDRMNPTDRIETIFMVHRKWNALTGKPPKVGCEQIGLMTDIHYLKLKQQQDAYHFPVVPLGAGQRISKEERIRKLIPIMQNGRWYMPASHIYVDGEGRRWDLTREFIEGELKTFPKSRYDDMMDTASRILDEELSMVFPRPNVGTVAKARRLAASSDAGTWEDM